MTRIFLIATVSLTSTLGASVNDQLDQRFRVPNLFAQKIAGELYPSRCGPEGKSCSIVFPPANCPKLFSIVFPDSHEGKSSSPERVWVTVDGLGQVVAVDHERPACKGGIST